MKTSNFAVTTGFVLQVAGLIAASNDLPNISSAASKPGSNLMQSAVTGTNIVTIYGTIYSNAAVSRCANGTIYFRYDKGAASEPISALDNATVAKFQINTNSTAGDIRAATIQEKPCDTLTIIFVKKQGWCGSLVRVTSHVDARGKRSDFGVIPQTVFLDESCYRAVDWASGDQVTVRARFDGYTITEDIEGIRSRLESWTLCDLAPSRP